MLKGLNRNRDELRFRKRDRIRNRNKMKSQIVFFDPKIIFFFSAVIFNKFWVLIRTPDPQLVKMLDHRIRIALNQCGSETLVQRLDKAPEPDPEQEP